MKETVETAHRKPDQKTGPSRPYQFERAAARADSHYGQGVFHRKAGYIFAD